MRPIKFRAWDKKDKIFVTRVSLEGTLCNKVILNIFDFFKESDYEFTQFTGLLDINGKEIYEGDVLMIKNVDTDKKYPDDIKILEVNWGHYDDGEYVSNIECWMAGSYNAVSELLVRTKYKYNTWQLTIEKIGNIFENSELIEKK